MTATHTVAGEPHPTSTITYRALLRRPPQGPAELVHVRTTVVSQRARSETTLDAAPELETLPRGLRAELPDDIVATADPCADRGDRDA